MKTGAKFVAFPGRHDLGVAGKNPVDQCRPASGKPYNEYRPISWRCRIDGQAIRQRFRCFVCGMVVGLDDTPIQIFTYLSLAAIAILLYQGLTI